MFFLGAPLTSRGRPSRTARAGTSLTAVAAFAAVMHTAGAAGSLGDGSTGQARADSSPRPTETSTAPPAASPPEATPSAPEAAPAPVPAPEAAPAPAPGDPAPAAPAPVPAPVSPGHWGRAIVNAAREAGIAPELVAAVVEVESASRADARSPAGAVGLMQLMPATAAELGVNPEDPIQNLSGGARYLAYLLRRFGQLDLALAAYNAGPTAVARAGGIPDYPETRNYVAKVLERLPE